ncbi:hypothetical protein Golax_010455 [Gossypium laxum]|uniref:Zinc knuckle CX2CX4HX4C domain-containing protein n=1 Tax=Gossypium laxum TaxID=34288 RepID=A0A7J8ZHA5_9ROSI|nr:hypothetical protein [Gossypium laxum]
MDDYEFNITPFWIRIYNIPFEQMDREVAIDVGKAIGEVVVIDWHDRNGRWTEYIRIRVKIDVLRPLRRVVHLVGSEGTETVCAIKYERLPAFCYICGLIGHTTQKCNRKEEHLETNNLNFQYGSWLKPQLGGPTQARGNQRNGIEILEKKINQREETNGNKDGNGEENDLTMPKGKDKARVVEEESESCSPIEKRLMKTTRDGMGKMKCKRKRMKGSNGENNEESPTRQVQRNGLGNPTIVRELKQPLVANNPNIVFLCKTKMHSNNFSCIRNICRMAGCLAVNSEGRSGGLALLWKDGVDVSIQNYSRHHMDLLVRMENHNSTRFTGFYGHEDPNLRERS